METYYLVDFENVHNEGLKNIDELSKTDHVHIFYTDNASNIKLNIVLTGSVDIKGHNIPIGKQSVDMHLISYLGYLLGTNKGKQCSFVIISKDKGYDNVITFWKEAGYKTITRKEKISRSQMTNNQSNRQQKPQNSTNKSAGKLYGQEKCRLNEYVQHAMLEVGYDSRFANRICSFVATVYGKERALSELHNLIRNEYEYEYDYIEIYQDVKDILLDYEEEKKSNQRKEKKKSTQLNTEIQKVIAKAGFPNDIVNSVASLVVRNAGTANAKQNIHTALVREFGRMRGADFYNRVKNYV